MWYPGGYWPWGGYSSGFWWNSIPRRQGPVFGPTGAELEEEIIPGETTEEWTADELARAWMASGDVKQAIRWYQTHLDESPDDLSAMRGYAAALLEDGRLSDAVALMGYVYDMAPGLTSRPMDSLLWGDSAFRMRQSVTRAVRYAHQAGSGNAWLLVAVLMQAEGRDEVALRMAQRARELGLAPAVADRLEHQLSRR